MYDTLATSLEMSPNALSSIDELLMLIGGCLVLMVKIYLIKHLRNKTRNSIQPDKTDETESQEKEVKDKTSVL